jgi:hypothetical protein
MSQVEETIKRIQEKNTQVTGILIVNSQFKIIRSTYPENLSDQALKIAKLIP